MKIGILGIQGDYEAHARVLDRLGIARQFVRTPADLNGISGIILPGGESSTHLKVLTEEGLFDALKSFAAGGGAFFGTCAGAILLAREVHGPAQASLALLDIVVRRNGYGRQLASDVHLGSTSLRNEPLEMVSFARRSSNRWGRASKSWRRMMGIPFSSARAESSLPLFILN